MLTPLDVPEAKQHLGLKLGLNLEHHAGTAGFGRRDALKALINLELDFESPDFTGLSEDAQSFVKASLHVAPTR